MVKISEEIKKKEDLINQEFEDQTSSRPTGNEIAKKSVAAILGGPAEWIDYMNLFAGGDPANLAKLMPELNPTSDSDIANKNRARAYLVANGVCGGESPAGVPLSFGVGTTLDQGLLQLSQTS